MKLMYSACLTALFALTSASAFAQTAKNAAYKGEIETRVVRGCEYEVVKGLAEIVEVTKTKDKSESALGHDEYTVKFKFIPMEGAPMLATLKDETLEFLLQSGYDKVPVGPKYIAHYHVRKGLKFAMQLLQNRKGACNETYTYESKGLPNDLFESQDNLIDYKKQLAEEKLAGKERQVSGEDPNAFDKTPNPNELKDPAANTTDKNPKVKPEEAIDNKNPTENPSENPTEEPSEEPKEEVKPKVELNEEELRKELEAELRKKAGLGDKNESLDSMRARLEAQVRAEEEARAKAEADAARKNAVKNAKQQAKEEEARRKEEEKRKAEEDKLREAEIAAKKEELKKDLETKILAEAEEKKRKEDALKDQIAKEIRRGSCVYQEKISGSIEIVAVDKVAEKEQSVFGYTEYEVKYKFRPDNYSEIQKKDRKIWDEVYTFKIDPKGKSANPSATYIRKNQVFKGQKYKGFAQVLESGICQAMMIYAPELPIDAGQVK